METAYQALVDISRGKKYKLMGHDDFCWKIKETIYNIMSNNYITINEEYVFVSFQYPDIHIFICNTKHSKRTRHTCILTAYLLALDVLYSMGIITENQHANYCLKLYKLHKHHENKSLIQMEW